MSAPDRPYTTPDIHRARLANLADDPPELGEGLAEYVGRITREFGTTYADAARELHQRTTGREARAAAGALAAVNKAMKPHA